MRRKNETVSFPRQLWSMVLPMAFQNLILSAVSAGDAAMLGLVSQDALSAVSLATQVVFVMNLFCGTCTAGATLIAAQYWGKGDKAAVQRILGLILQYAGLVSLAFFAAAALLPETLMRIFTREKALITIGADYLRIAGWSFLPTGLGQCYHCMLKTTGRAKESAAISAVAIVTDLALNAVFIFGLLGLPAMGAKGAALTTIFSRTLELALVWRASTLHPKAAHVLRPERGIIREFWHYSTPVLLNSMVWGLGVTTYSVIIGHLGSDATAANSIAAVVRDLVTSLCRGISSAVGILLGHTLGANQLEEARHNGDQTAKLSILCGVFSGAVVLLCIPVLSHVFVLTEAARGYLQWMLGITAVYMLGRAVNDVVICGIFHAGGDTRFDAQSVATSMWGVIIPLAAMAAFWWNWPVLAVYFILSMDEIIKLPWVYRHYKMYKWVCNITEKTGAAA